MITNNNDVLNVCPVCEGPAQEVLWARKNWGRAVSCPTCGEVVLTHEALVNSRTMPREHRVLLAGYLRHNWEATHHPFRLFQAHVDDPEASLGLAPLPVVDRIIATLKALADKSSHFGADVIVNTARDWSLGWCSRSDEFQNILNHLVRQGLLGLASSPGQDGEQAYLVTADGWATVEEDRSQHPVVPTKAFVAMSFADDMTPIWTDGFLPGIKAAGFTPFRIDQQQFNEKICDRILAEIRSCGLLVADFTHHRGGVYFEAGFALGLGKHVIWTCKKTYLKKAHFDTRQYNHIAWKDAADLRAQLEDRIRATVPPVGR